MPIYKPSPAHELLLKQLKKEWIELEQSSHQRNLLHLLDLIEKAEDKKSWVDIAFATSTLRDILEELPHNNPYPWEE